MTFADACRLCAERLDLPDVIAVDARSDAAREALSPWLVAGDTLVLLGSSGVGKSTLVNTLAGMELQRTGGVQTGDSKGRHIFFSGRADSRLRRSALPTLTRSRC